jgi:hypothetical protein
MLFALPTSIWTPNRRERMLSFVERLVSFLRQDELLKIEAESPSSLSLRCGRALTVFDRLSRTVTRNGKLVATFGSIQQIRVAPESTEEGPAAWSVKLQLTGLRVVQVGRTTDSTAASTAAAHIATITGARVMT